MKPKTKADGSPTRAQMSQINRKRFQVEKNERAADIREATAEAQDALTQIRDYFESGLGKLAKSYEKIMDEMIHVATGEVTEINGTELTPTQILKVRNDLLKLLPQHRPAAPDEERDKNKDVNNSLAGALADAKIDVHLHPTTEEVIDVGNVSNPKSLGPSLATTASTPPAHM